MSDYSTCSQLCTFTLLRCESASSSLTFLLFLVLFQLVAFLVSSSDDSCWFGPQQKHLHRYSTLRPPLRHSSHFSFEFRFISAASQPVIRPSAPPTAVRLPTWTRLGCSIRNQCSPKISIFKTQLSRWKVQPHLRFSPPTNAIFM